MYPWPFGEFDYVMDDALDIAMDYLIRTDQAINFRGRKGGCRCHRDRVAPG